MYSVELYNRVRRACHAEGMSKSEAARMFGIDRKTVSKILRHSVPAGYRRMGAHLNHMGVVGFPVITNDRPAGQESWNGTAGGADEVMREGGIADRGECSHSRVPALRPPVWYKCQTPRSVSRAIIRSTTRPKVCAVPRVQLVTLAAHKLVSSNRSRRRWQIRSSVCKYHFLRIPAA